MAVRTDLGEIRNGLESQIGSGGLGGDGIERLGSGGELFLELISLILLISTTETNKLSIIILPPKKISSKIIGQRILIFVSSFSSNFGSEFFPEFRSS